MPPTRALHLAHYAAQSTVSNTQSFPTRSTIDRAHPDGISQRPPLEPSPAAQLLPPLSPLIAAHLHGETAPSPSPGSSRLRVDHRRQRWRLPSTQPISLLPLWSSVFFPITQTSPRPCLLPRLAEADASLAVDARTPEEDARAPAPACKTCTRSGHRGSCRR
jgi:hypothetical protein